jgi:hypothetical protein
MLGAGGEDDLLRHCHHSQRIEPANACFSMLQRPAMGLIAAQSGEIGTLTHLSQCSLECALAQVSRLDRNHGRAQVDSALVRLGGVAGRVGKVANERPSAHLALDQAPLFGGSIDPGDGTE